MHRPLALLLLFSVALAVGGCPHQPPPIAVHRHVDRAPPLQPVRWQESKSGLGFRLRDADALPPEHRAARATPLSEKDVKALLGRLPPMSRAPEVKRFALREKSVPAPRPGETVKTAFPPAVKPMAPSEPVAADAPLRVERHAPEGPVSIAPELTITFSEPMVELTSHAELERVAPPVQLSPQPPGRWRWLGTQTVVFDPDGERFPMATEYQVTVPEGTPSASGKRLVKGERWSFSTPPATVEQFVAGTGSGPQRLEPLLFAAFNQRIDPARVLAHTTLRPESVSGEAAPVISLRLATEEEIEGSRELRNLRQSTEPGRWLAFRPAEPLRRAQKYTVTLDAAVPSAEGPRLNQKAQSYEFRTYAPLALERVRCAWGGDCPPTAPWSVEFNNFLDARSVTRDLVRVDPPIADMKVEVLGNHLLVRGRSRGRTRYTVTIQPGLRDTFEQVLEKEERGSVDVTAAEPVLFPEQNPMVVADPAFADRLAVFSVNHPALRLRLYRVTPEDWKDYLLFREAENQEQKLETPPGKLVLDKIVQTRKAPDELVETMIDLKPALTDGRGQVIVLVEPTTPPKRIWLGVARESVRCWVQATGIGLQAFWDQDTLHGWTSALSDGNPLAGAEVSLLGTQARATSDAGGLAKLALGSGAMGLMARRGADLAFLPGREWGGWGEERFMPSAPTPSKRWLFFTDRGLYKPGERVHAKGWVRTIGGGRGGDVDKLPKGAGRDLVYEVTDARAAEIAKGRAVLDDSGGFHISFDVPKNANLGAGAIMLSMPGMGPGHSHDFRIDEFRRPEFEVSASVGEGPYHVGEHAIASVSAAYYAGGGLPSAEVKWKVAATDATYRPPNLSTYHFGKAPRYFGWWRPSPRVLPEEWRARTGPDGTHRLRVDFDALAPYFPREFALEATVHDVNGQAWAARTTLLVHPADITVGLRTLSRVVRAGEDLVVDALVTDLDGKPIIGRSVELRSVLLDWDQVAGDFVERETDVATCQLTSTAKPGRCVLPTRSGGERLVSAVVTDRHGRKSRSELRLWVLGDDAPAGPRVPQGKVELIPDREEYAGGDKARLVVMAPFAPAEGVLTVRREGIEQIRRVTLRKNSEVLEVDLLARYVPNVTVRLDVVGVEVREGETGRPDPSLPRRPAFASGSVVLKVPPTDRTLEIAIEPTARTAEPGRKTSVGLTVKDASGRPMPAADVALVVVDESVLALTGYETPDPLEAFYVARGEGTEDLELRWRTALMRPDYDRMRVRAQPDLGARNGHRLKRYSGGGAGQMSGGAPEAMPSAMPAPRPAAPAATAIADAKVRLSKSAAGARSAAPLAVRFNWSALAAFIPNLRTDARGRASASFKLPDNLTRYRVMAVAASGRNRFGSAEASITARLPLMVRASPPRFLNFGDRFELPVVVQNQTGHRVVADVVARAANLELIGARGLRVSVPANDRVEVRFPAAAARPGTARLQVGAASEAGTDASEHELPVWTPATSESFATYGSIEQGALAQPVRRPGDAVKEWGGLELTTSSTALQGLTDAVLYLAKYPYDCNEQIASRVLTIAALRDVLDAFQADGLPPKAALLASMTDDMKKLAERQHGSGGWDWWRCDREPSPFVSVHVMHALVRAKLKGFAVPEATYDQGLEYIGQLPWRVAADLPKDVRQVVLAYALYVRSLAGEPDPESARRLAREAGGIEALPLEAVGFLWPVFTGKVAYQKELDTIRRFVNNRATETAGNAHFVTSYDDGGWLLLASDRRADGILLEAMIGDQPESSLIPKVVKGLLADRKRGRWTNTQDNAFVLLALDRYFAKYENVTPDFVARAWLGDAFVAEHRFRGRSTERQHVEVPMEYLSRLAQPASLVIGKDGPGRLYYRLGMQYAPKDLWLAPADHGFAVSRTYEGMERPGDVRRGSDGVWHVKRGATVRVRVGLVARARRYHVALVDPLPAGFEPLNPAFATTETIPTELDASSRKSPWWWSRAWYEHQNLRDERAEAFASLLWDGVYEYVYAARATTPGEFVVPPPKAEEMYDPETFGRGASDRVIVE